MPAPERRLVASLVATTLMLWIGASAIIPLLPTYLHRHGTPSSLVGIVMTSNFACAVMTQYPVGRLCDRIGSRPVLVAGLVVFMAGSVGFAIQVGTWPALVYRSTQGIGLGGAGLASAAMIAQRVTSGRRGRTFALFYASQSFLCQPVLGARDRPGTRWPARRLLDAHRLRDGGDPRRGRCAAGPSL